MPDLIFQSSPVIRFATNTFINVPVILQYETTPLLQVVHQEKAGFSTEFKIYNKDGVYIAKVCGSRIFLTPEGKKARLTRRNPQGMTVVELDDKPIIELRRLEAAALKTEAELYTPDGAFLKSSDAGLTGYVLDSQAQQLEIAGIVMKNCTFSQVKIGVHVFHNGRVAIAGR
jgi:hypothetical protein